MDAQGWYLRTSKLAVALAIIRSKPADKSSREYTEQLARVVSGEECKCRSKVQDLETEILQLRQKVLLSGMSPAGFRRGHDLLPTSSDQSPLSPENTPTLQEDSGCVLSNEQRTEQSETSQHCMENCLLIPFQPLPIMKSHSATTENPLSSHMQFLQHLFELKNFTESDSLKTDLTKFENDYSTVSDAVFQLLDGLITFYNNPQIPFSSFQTEAVCTVAKLFSDHNLSNHILNKCSKKLEELEKTLLQVILRNNHINRFQGQHYVSQSLVTLGSCSILRKSLVALLLAEVNSFTDYLEIISQAQGSYDVTRYENNFFLFWVLEQLLQKETEQGGISSQWKDDQEIKRFLQKHDQTIFQLSDAFPLFTFYLWRLSVLFNSTEKETVENNSSP
ncbi:PREDICTED: meiosis-specific protein MEI4-like [Elephantulus edwardii]|uniref:meiosis-specific protein MEI4-like n=1 Tax=Elephantulus edwardii TaxID=28737 RepID=UPI0003F0E4A4|nr:PREDICTED: meiosis-specific protein MEI4-like [Elephantulus edwardii]